MSLSTALIRGAWSTVRHIEGAPAAVDDADLSTFNTRALINCRGYKTIVVGARIASAGSGTATVQVWGYDASDGKYFKLDTTAALVDGATAEVKTYEQQVLLRVSAVSNDPTAIDLKATVGDESISTN